MAKQASKRMGPAIATKFTPHHIAKKVVPARRAFVLLETGLLIGLAEGVLNNLITRLPISIYLKALLLMAGVVGVFAIAVRILEPVIAWVLKFVSKLDTGSGPLLRLGLHAAILFLIFVSYVRIFFMPH